jgi:hypothetical protein
MPRRDAGPTTRLPLVNATRANVGTRGPHLPDRGQAAAAVAKIVTHIAPFPRRDGRACSEFAGIYTPVVYVRLVCT